MKKMRRFDANVDKQSLKPAILFPFRQLTLTVRQKSLIEVNNRKRSG